MAKLEAQRLVEMLECRRRHRCCRRISVELLVRMLVETLVYRHLRNLVDLQVRMLVEMSVYRRLHSLVVSQVASTEVGRLAAAIPAEMLECHLAVVASLHPEQNTVVDLAGENIEVGQKAEQWIAVKRARSEIRFANTVEVRSRIRSTAAKNRLALEAWSSRGQQEWKRSPDRRLEERQIHSG